MKKEMYEAILEELRFLQSTYPEAMKKYAKIKEELLSGKLLGRVYSAPRWSEQRDCHCFYGHLFAQEKKVGPVVAQFRNHFVQRSVEKLPFVIFAKWKEEGELDDLTPLEAWLYLCMDKQFEQEGFRRETLVPENNVSVSALLQVFEAFEKEQNFA